MLVEVVPVLNDLQTKLAGQNGDQVFDALKKILRGEDPFLSQTVDLSATPFIPDGWSVEEHQKGGQFVWDPTKVRLHLDEGQTDRRYVEGHKLRKLISKKNPYNANLLDFLLKNGNQHLIPEEWKGKAVFFWGTIYRGSGGDLCVRYLDWGSGRWRWSFIWLDGDWDGDGPALVPAS